MRDPGPLLCINNGLGQDSAAMTAALVLGKLPAHYYAIPPERRFLMFSDTGAEWPLTYAWKAKFEGWLKLHGLDLITLEPGGPYHEKEPSKQYPNGRIQQDIMFEHMKDAEPSFPTRQSGRCTENAKGSPLAKKRDELSIAIRGMDYSKLGRLAGQGKAEPNIVMIGYAADEMDRAAASDAQHTAKNWRPVYPLIEMGLDRAGCRELIKEAGLVVPPKSGCVCCPYQSIWAYCLLEDRYPEEYARVLAMEDKAIAEKRRRNKAPYYITGKYPLREAVLRWRLAHPNETPDFWEAKLYEKDAWAVGRKCSLETEGTFCGALELELDKFPVFQ